MIKKGRGAPKKGWRAWCFSLGGAAAAGVLGVGVVRLRQKTGPQAVLQKMRTTATKQSRLARPVVDLLKECTLAKAATKAGWPLDNAISGLDDNAAFIIIKLPLGEYAKLRATSDGFILDAFVDDHGKYYSHLMLPPEMQATDFPYREFMQHIERRLHAPQERGVSPAPA